MSLTEDDVIQILKFMDQSRFEELHLSIGDLKLMVSKHGGAATASLPGSAAPMPQEAAAPSPSAVAQAAPAPAPQARASKIKTGLAQDEKLVTITAPMLGVFYRAPKPDAPPFVEAGSLVSENDTVCIIEVMKLFSHVKAGVSGRVVEICADNEELVEYKQALFVIDPEAKD